MNVCFSVTLVCSSQLLLLPIPVFIYCLDSCRRQPLYREGLMPLPLVKDEEHEHRKGKFFARSTQRITSTTTVRNCILNSYLENGFFKVVWYWEGENVLN